jgi:hypothetical protein
MVGLNHRLDQQSGILDLTRGDRMKRAFAGRRGLGRLLISLAEVFYWGEGCETEQCARELWITFEGLICPWCTIFIRVQRQRQLKTKRMASVKP